MNTRSLWWETLNWELEESWVGKQRMQGLVSSTPTRRPWQCREQGGWAPSLFLVSLRHRQVWLGKCLELTQVLERVWNAHLPAASTNCRIALASYGTPPEGSWVPGECFLADAHPSLPFPNDLCLLCFGIGALLGVISFYLSCIKYKRVLLWFIPFNLVVDPSPPCLCRENACISLRF